MNVVGYIRVSTQGKAKDGYSLKYQEEEIKAYCQKGLTPHHKNSTEIELIPTDLHANIPHIGSASDLRGGK